MSGAAKTDAKGDVSRAPGWKELFSLAALIGAAILFGLLARFM